ncbi:MULTISPECIES: hypothetical protein [Pseudomonas]|uniref:hypothetical protein n=1 Tax=Pseudomonas TaxID=286 RepID=UPI000AEB8BEE|nr:MULTISPECIES: hypothetical protein [Pseudomonas]
MGVASADAVITEMIEALECLETFTGLGRPSQTPDVRELIFARYPFIAPCRLRYGEV